MDPLPNDAERSNNQPPGEAKVPQEFIKLYYRLLNDVPDLLHQLYLGDSSALVSEAQDDGPPLRVQADNIEDIKQVMMMFSDVQLTVTEYTPQDSLDDSLILLTTGTISKKPIGDEDISDTERLFTQAFVLAKQESGFYVKTDILQIHSRGCPYKLLSRAGIHSQEPGRTIPVISSSTPPLRPDPAVPHKEIQYTSPPAIQAEVSAHVFTSEDPVEVDIPRNAQPMVDSNDFSVQKKSVAPAESIQVNNVVDSRSQTSRAGVNPRSQPAVQPEKIDARVQPPVETVAPISGPAPKLSYAQVLREKKVAAAAAAASQSSKTDDFKVVAQHPKQTVESSYPPRQGANTDSVWGQPLSGSQPQEKQPYSGNAVVGSASNFKLFASHLPLNATPAKVAEAFSTFGEVVDPDSVSIMNRSRNCMASVTFQNEASFRMALEGNIPMGNDTIVTQPWENRARTPRQPDGRGGKGRHNRRRGGWDHAQ